jgi:predicted DsbA family dithiol-disulfide isomerase
VLEQEREAHELGIHSVPSVIVGNYLIPGAVPYETLKRAVAVASGREPANPGASRT